MTRQLQAGQVVRLDGCRLRVAEGAWPYAETKRAEIAAAWQQRIANNPKYFNGEVQMLVRHEIVDGAFVGDFVSTDFASFVHWWDAEFPDAGVRDCFGSAILRSAEGHCMLGIQAGGNLNSGRAYFPGGFIDRADVKADRSIDIDGSITREIVEETGLDIAGLQRKPGYILTCAQSSIAIGIEFRSRLAAADLRAEMLRNMARDQDAELSDVLIVRRTADIAGVPTTNYVPPLLRALLD